VLAMAPLATIIIYDAGAGSNDMIGVLTLEAQDNKADIVTQSYSWHASSAMYAAAHTQHLSMSAQGMTCTNGSGDHGTASLDGSSSFAAHPYPAIDPDVLIVGGTTTETASKGGALTSITGWSGSGGGWAVTTDPFNVLPPYQKGTGVPTNVNYRLSPDVALNADPKTPFYTYLEAGDYGNFTIPTTGLYAFIGGTSGAGPTFAASLAIAEQQIIANGGLPPNSKGKRRLGRVQDLLYWFNGNSSIFTDITSGSNGPLPSGATSEAGVGWDSVTGWGVMNLCGQGCLGFCVADECRGREQHGSHRNGEADARRARRGCFGFVGVVRCRICVGAGARHGSRGRDERVVRFADLRRAGDGEREFNGIDKRRLGQRDAIPRVASPDDG
jgi:subtilase family serine protease